MNSRVEIRLPGKRSEGASSHMKLHGTDIALRPTDERKPVDLWQTKCGGSSLHGCREPWRSPSDPRGSLASFPPCVIPALPVSRKFPCKITYCNRSTGRHLIVKRFPTVLLSIPQKKVQGTLWRK
jgi:hypothetical protein